MKYSMIGLLIVFVVGLNAQVELPTTHVSLMMDGNFFSGARGNDGTYDHSNRYQIRKATLNLAGTLSDRVEYNAEYGVSTCSGSGSGMQLIEAEVMYEAIENLRVGIIQGHVLRGFYARTECVNRLTAEKPNFAKTFGNCHPLGAVANYFLELPDGMSLETEIALMNGTNGTIDGERDDNFGVLFQTPLPGFSLVGMYNHTARNYYDESYEQFSDDGYRAGGGFEYLRQGIWITSEYQLGKGFERNEQKMEAWYAQTGYEISTGWKPIVAIQPYACFENWDKDTDLDQLYQYTEAGISLKLSGHSLVRIACKMNTNKPAGVNREPSLTLVRLQTTL
jgi:hypothetical protein